MLKNRFLKTKTNKTNIEDFISLIFKHFKVKKFDLDTMFALND